MELDDRLTLACWAEGLAGADARLARRAWWVLQDQARVPPRELIGVWANAAEAQVWLRNYHATGLVGLIDAPRAGRPRKHGKTVDEAKARLHELESSRFAGTQIASGAVLGPLTRTEREALWRSLRTSGTNVIRKRHGRDLVIPVKSDIRDVICVLLTAQMKLLAFMNESESVWAGLNGVWLSVPMAKKNGSWTVGKNLTDVLKLDVSYPPPKTGTDPKKNRAKREETATRRAVNHLHQLAEDNPGKISVTVFMNIDSGAPALRLLKHFKSMRLWRDSSGRNPGLLKDLRVIPYKDTWAFALQTTLAEQLRSSSVNAVSEFQDSLTLRRSEPFCWLGGDDEEIDQQGSYTWLAPETR